MSGAGDEGFEIDPRAFMASADDAAPDDAPPDDAAEPAACDASSGDAFEPGDDAVSDR